MAANYTNLLQVGVDLGIWSIINKQATATLNLFSAIAKNRWTWIVTNWSRLYPQFKRMTQGNQTLLDALVDFDNAVQSYNLGNTNNPLNDSQKFLEFYPFLQAVNLTSLNLIPAEKILYANEIQRVQQFNAQDFRNMREFIKYSIAYSGSYLGHSDPQGTPIYADIVVKPARQATFDDFLQLNSMVQLQEMIEGIIFSYKQKQSASPNLLKIANQNIAAGSNVTVRSAYLSSIAVPFQGTLETMAKTYLGDSRRWYELVTVNKLQPPFFDQNGTKVPLLSPGNPNNVTVDGTLATDCPVGSKVSVGSLTYREQTRVVERQTLNTDGTMTLFLSGDQDLTSLLSTQKAYVRIRKAGTVYDGSFILIPLSAASKFATMPTPTSDLLRRLDTALLAFGVDIMRDEKTGDIVTDGSGNFQIVYGLAAVRQAIYWAIRTIRGELAWHPTFGVQQSLGATYMGSTTEAAIFFEQLQSSLLKDRRFQSINVQGIRTTGTSISLDLLIQLGGSNVPIPLSFVV